MSRAYAIPCEPCWLIEAIDAAIASNKGRISDASFGVAADTLENWRSQYEVDWLPYPKILLRLMRSRGFRFLPTDVQHRLIKSWLINVTASVEEEVGEEVTQFIENLLEIIPLSSLRKALSKVGT